MDTAQLLHNGPGNSEKVKTNTKNTSYLKMFAMTITKGFRQIGLYFDGFQTYATPITTVLTLVGYGVLIFASIIAF
jgi:hypothetical protein